MTAEHAARTVAHASVLVKQFLADLDDHDVGFILCQTLKSPPALCAGVADFAFQLITTSVTTSRLTGTLHSYNAKNGYSFIECPEALAICPLGALG